MCMIDVIKNTHVQANARIVFAYLWTYIHTQIFNVKEINVIKNTDRELKVDNTKCWLLSNYVKNGRIYWLDIRICSHKTDFVTTH